MSERILPAEAPPIISTAGWRRPPTLLLVSLLAFPSAAQAQALSSDIELLSPKPSPGALPGLESSARDEVGTLRVQTTLQFEDSPLVLYSDEGEVGAVVHRRITGHIGVGATLTKRLRIGGSLPMHGQWGSEVPDLAADGFGVGDLTIRGAYWLGRSAVGDFTAHLGFSLPFGRRNAWMGDQGPRTQIGVAYATGVRRTEIHADVGFDARGAFHTDADLYDRGSALLVSTGVRTPIVSDKVDLFGTLSTRWGAGIFQRRPDFVLSAMAGATYKPAESVGLDFGLGRGFTPGVGTTDIRVLAQVTWHRKPEPDIEPEEEPIEIIVRKEEIPEPDPEPEPEPEEPPPAQIVGEQVIVTAPILFFVDTANLKPESKAAMEAIAGLMADDPQIGHLVIEGHASAEGTHEYNYDLSARRARAIHEALMVEGVHKSRISYRGMGEVEPIVPGEDEEALAANRRVEFHIINRRGPGDGDLEHSEQSPLPWSGDPVDTPRPEWPEEVLKKYEEDQAKIQKALGPMIEEDTEDPFVFDDPELAGPVRVALPPEARQPTPEPSPVTKPEPVVAPEPAVEPEPVPPAPTAEQPAPVTEQPAPVTKPDPEIEPAEPAAEAPTTTEPVAEATPTKAPGRYIFRVYGKFLPLFTEQTDKLRADGALPDKHYDLTLDATIDASGRLLSVKVSSTSGVEALDGAALRAFFQAQPFDKPPPEELTDGKLQLTGIRFDVEGSGTDSEIDVPSGDRLEEMLQRDAGGEQ